MVVLPEICHLIASSLGHQMMHHFVSSLILKMTQVEPLLTADLTRVHKILEQYADRQLNFPVR